MDVNELAEIAARWWSTRAGSSQDVGVVVIYNGAVQGWMSELRTPESWAPGCVAFSRAGQAWKATRGRWRSIPAGEESLRPSHGEVVSADPAGWAPFDYADYECGLFWLLVATPDLDVDVDDYGHTIGTYTGETNQEAVLSWVEEDHDGQPYFEAVDGANFGCVPDDGVVTHFAEVKAPAIPKQANC